jgi:hypothetical protein
MKKYSSLILSVFLSLTNKAEAVQEGKCYALALSSGDEAAAYQAGALSGIFTSNLS